MTDVLAPMAPSGTRLLHEDRYFDPDPAIRRVARTLYEETRALPIVSPHGHVDPRILAEDAPFPEPAALILRPDHYILRMLYARGVPLEALLEGDPRKSWRLFAEHYFPGLPRRTSGASRGTSCWKWRGCRSPTGS